MEIPVLKTKTTVSTHTQSKQLQAFKCKILYYVFMRGCGLRPRFSPKNSFRANCIFAKNLEMVSINKTATAVAYQMEKKKQRTKTFMQQYEWCAHHCISL